MKKNKSGIVKFKMLRPPWLIAMLIILILCLTTIILFVLEDSITSENFYKVLLLAICTVGFIMHILYILRLKLVFNFNDRTIIFRTWWFKTTIIPFEDIISGQLVTETDIFGLSPSKAYILTTKTKKIRITLFYQSFFKKNLEKNLDEFHALMARVYKERSILDQKK